jgi:hypothetical protein
MRIAFRVKTKSLANLQQAAVANKNIDAKNIKGRIGRTPR